MGKVYLVGAGPGSVDLLTVRAMRLIQSADTLLYDALVGVEILQLASPKARLINVGKRKGKKSFTQDEINALIIYSAHRSGTVVRLKGGDPSIFGRAAEEISALKGAGIEFEIVPGITAACSAAAAAKISLTDRRVSSEVTFTTAHHGTGNIAADWLDGFSPDRTFVIYMPGSDYDHLREQFLAAGIPANTPCAVVSQIESVRQEIVSTNVGQLGDLNSLPAPALLIVGQVAREAEQSTDARRVSRATEDAMEIHHVVNASAT